jgi:hypothetical protein
LRGELDLATVRLDELLDTVRERATVTPELSVLTFM